MNDHLLIKGITALLISVHLYIESKSNDSQLLLFMIFTEMILILGIYKQSDKIVQISHIFYVIYVLLGTLFFTEKNNLYFLMVNILIYFLTNVLYNGCMYRLTNHNFKFKIESLWSWVNWDMVFALCLIITQYRLSYIL